MSVKRALIQVVASLLVGAAIGGGLVAVLVWRSGPPPVSHYQTVTEEVAR
jgi:hypothetical protein